MKKLQRMLLRRVRDRAAEVELPFRCDGPSARREMDIQIASTSGGRLILFRATLRAEEARGYQSLIDPAAERGGDLVEMCGWCDRFRVDSEWVEIEQAAARLELFRRSAPPSISHGICSNCSDMLLAA